MTIQTYDQLVTEVKALLNFSDLDGHIPSFIRLAESQFERELRVREMDKRVKIRLDSDSVTLPTDFLRLTSLYDSDKGQKLEYKPIDDLEARKSQIGAPTLFSIVGDELIFWPVPTDTVNLVLRYEARVDGLSAENSINPILTNYPDVYFYGTLLHAGEYLREDESVAKWGALFARGVEDANKLNRRLVRQSYRMRPSGAPV